MLLLRIARFLVILIVAVAIYCRPQVNFNGVPQGSIAVGAKISVKFEIVFTDESDVPFPGIDHDSQPELDIVPDDDILQLRLRLETRKDSEEPTRKRSTRYRKSVQNSINVLSNSGVYRVQAAVEDPDGFPQNFFSEPFTATARADQPTSTPLQVPTFSSGAGPQTFTGTSTSTLSWSTSASNSASESLSSTNTVAVESTSTPGTSTGMTSGIDSDISPPIISQSNITFTLTNGPSLSESGTPGSSSSTSRAQEFSTSTTAATGSPSQDLIPNHRNPNRIGIIVGIVVAVFVVLLLSGCLLVVRRYRHSRAIVERECARPYRLLLGDVQAQGCEKKILNLEIRAGQSTPRVLDQVVGSTSGHGGEIAHQCGSEARLPAGLEPESIVHIPEDLPPEYRTAC